jgi:hypothetical protein
MFTLGVASEIVEALIKWGAKGGHQTAEETLPIALELLLNAKWWYAALVGFGSLVALWLYVCATEKETRQAEKREPPSPGI